MFPALECLAGSGIGPKDHPAPWSKPLETKKFVSSPGPGLFGLGEKVSPQMEKGPTQTEDRPCCSTEGVLETPSVKFAVLSRLPEQRARQVVASAPFRDA
jgi:hypothetical protein